MRGHIAEELGPCRDRVGMSVGAGLAGGPHPVPAKQKNRSAAFGGRRLRL